MADPAGFNKELENCEIIRQKYPIKQIKCRMLQNNEKNYKKIKNSVDKSGILVYTKLTKTNSHR